MQDIESHSFSNLYRSNHLEPAPKPSQYHTYLLFCRFMISEKCLSFFLGRYQSSPPCWRIQNSHLCRLTNDMVARNRRSWHRQKRFGKLSSCSSHTCPLQKVAYKTLHDLASANNGLWACICPSRSCSCNIWSWLG